MFCVCVSGSSKDVSTLASGKGGLWLAPNSDLGAMEGG